ncbi:MAG: hypothetical protein ACM31L_05980 [Actinomycetota bacterium]
MFEMDYSAARSAVEARPLDAAEMCGNWFATTVDRKSGMVCEALMALGEDGRYSLLACHFQGGAMVAGYASRGGWAVEGGALELSDDQAGICLAQELSADRDVTGGVAACRIAGLPWARCPCDPEWFMGGKAAPSFAGGGILGEIAHGRGGPAMIRNTDWSRRPRLAGLAELCRDTAPSPLMCPSTPLLS